MKAGNHIGTKLLSFCLTRTLFRRRILLYYYYYDDDTHHFVLSFCLTHTLFNMISSSYPRRIRISKSYHFGLQPHQLRPLMLLLVLIVCLGLLKQEQTMLTTSSWTSVRLSDPPEEMKNIMNKNTNSRIMIAVAAYNLDAFGCFDRMFDSFRDICEGGFSVDLFIYTARDWPQDVMESLESRMACRHPLAQFNASMIIKHPGVGHDLVRYHKTLFYENLDNYDLFIYTEDDHLVRLRHVTAYLEETNRLKQTLGNTRFMDYSIGFLRYERIEEENFAHATFEHKWNLKYFAEAHMVPVEGINDTSYFSPGGYCHQGMYMATNEQLRAWSERPNCRFNDTNVRNGMIREYISSLWLFYHPEGCKVTQLIPVKSYRDFFIHHLADKYVHQWQHMAFRANTIGSMLRNSTNTTTTSGGGSGGLIKIIDERP